MHDRLMALADELAAEGESAARACPDPVNAAMIRNWTRALGDRSGRWSEHAPPAMIQVWSMTGPGDRTDEGDPAESAPDRILSLLDEGGYTGVVATNCEHTYDRYLRLGEELSTTVRFGDVTGPKRTALGEGYFVTWYERWYSGGERVAEMLFRVLKFKPRGDAPVIPSDGRYPLRPAVGPDTRFFWDGARAGELRIQRCAECGALRHPPGPMCPACHATKRDHV
ncbi:Zn-ribbon domain-containing OB-fold protein, partial [Actinoallomurus acaciae]